MLAVAACVAVGGCGSAEDERERRQQRTAWVRTDTLAMAKELLVPPPIFLVTEAGRQRAAPGKSCVLTVGQGRGEGAAECHIPRRPVRPKEVSVVRRGDAVLVVVPGAAIVRRQGCVGRHECGGWATVRPLGCPRREVAFFELEGGETRWRADVPPGAYELDVSIDFETAAGLTGDTSGVLGLLVARRGEPEILRFRPELARCRPRS